MASFTTPNCSNCGGDLIAKQDKKGNTYYACPNWKKDGSGCKGEIYYPPEERSEKFKKWKAQYTPNQDKNEVMDALRQIWEKIDNFEVSVKKLDEILRRCENDGKVVFYPKDERPE